jgi:hypothetical protein
MSASTSFADRHFRLRNGQPAGSGELRDRKPPRGPIQEATYSAGPGHPHKPGASCSPRCKPQAVHRRVWPSRTRPRRRPFLSAMEALDEQERVAVSLFDRALPGRTPLSHPNR